MISDARFDRVLAWRETHRSRSTAVSVVLVILALGFAYLGTECVLAALGYRALLVAPADAIRVWREGTPAALAVAAGLAVLALIVLLIAVLPSRRPRHRIRDPRSVLLVDDDVLASAISQSVSRHTGIASSQSRTSVGRRSVDVAVTPTSGRPLSGDDVRTHAADLVETLDLQPATRVRARVATNGVVGA